MKPRALSGLQLLFDRLDKRIADVIERQGTELEWVTPHTFRKTVATLIAERVGAEIAAQQLGHSSPEITREFYIAKPAIAADVAHVLSELADLGRG